MTGAPLRPARLIVFVLLVFVISSPLLAREYVRSGKVHRAFLKASGYPTGRPGFVADHIFPLCAGGKDAVANLQWQPIPEARVKDRAEKLLCARIRALVTTFDHDWTPVP